MVFDYDDLLEVPNLAEYKKELINEILKNAFFQKYYKEKKKWNMLKVPVIAAPSLVRKQIY